MNSTPRNKCCLSGGAGRGAGQGSGVQHFCVFGLKCSNEPQSKQPQNSCARVFASPLCAPSSLYPHVPLGWATTSTDSNNILCCSLLGAVFLLFLLPLSPICLSCSLFVVVAEALRRYCCFCWCCCCRVAAAVIVVSAAVALLVVVVCSLGQLDRTIQ